MFKSIKQLCFNFIYKNSSESNVHIKRSTVFFLIPVITCGPPAKILNGYWKPINGYCLVYQCTLRFMCNDGFRQTPERVRDISCNENRSWSHWIEKCEGLFKPINFVLPFCITNGVCFFTPVAYIQVQFR